MESLEDFLAKLEKEELSLMILKDGKIVYKSRDGGIAPLIEAIEGVGLESLSGSIVVDKVVGKAAALLIAYFQAKEVFAKIMSWKGAGILEREGIRFVAKELVENIKNRDGTGLCPFEMLVSEVEDSQEAYRLLRFKGSGWINSKGR
ncbi:DUF1893 domain-containing protein [Candidatus Bathyarchaeota archaeon]|nr:DUF1893 domain-containing protein [Candidatus Bathyarchaeota archaeon]